MSWHTTVLCKDWCSGSVVKSIITANGIYYNHSKHNRCASWRRLQSHHPLAVAVFVADEPTSGLDSTTALRLMHTLRSLASGGRTILTSIHQPSSRLYKQMDKVGRVLLLFGAHAAAGDCPLTSIMCMAVIRICIAVLHRVPLVIAGWHTSMYTPVCGSLLAQ